MHNYQKQHEELILSAMEKLFMCLGAAVFFAGMGLMIGAEYLG